MTVAEAMALLRAMANEPNAHLYGIDKPPPRPEWVLAILASVAAEWPVRPEEE